MGSSFPCNSDTSIAPDTHGETCLRFLLPRPQPSMPQSKVLHVAGSPVSQYYYMISVHYCRQMLAGASDAATKEAFDFMFAVVLPGGDWCLVSDLDEATIAAAPKLSHGEALTPIAAADYDACVPHMFCYPATVDRALMDFGVPLVGCSPECMAHHRNSSAAVRRPRRAGAARRAPPLAGADADGGVPFVLKPCCEDNSMGISKVENAEEPPALAEAFKFDDAWWRVHPARPRDPRRRPRGRRRRADDRAAGVHTCDARAPMPRRRTDQRDQDGLPDASSRDNAKEAPARRR